MWHRHTHPHKSCRYSLKSRRCNTYPLLVRYGYSLRSSAEQNLCSIKYVSQPVLLFYLSDSLQEPWFQTRLTSPLGYWEFWDFCWFHCCTTSGNAIAAKKETFQKMQSLGVSLRWTSQVRTLGSFLILVPKRIFRANWKKLKLRLSTALHHTPKVYLPRIRNLAPRRNIMRIFRRSQDRLLFTVPPIQRLLIIRQIQLGIARYRVNKLVRQEPLQVKIKKRTWRIWRVGRQAGSSGLSPPSGNVFASPLTCGCCSPASGSSL